MFNSSKPRGDDDYIAVIDLGSEKVVCAIVPLMNDYNAMPEISGLGIVDSQGIETGYISDMVLAEEAIREAIGLAERNANQKINSIVCAISGSIIKSKYMTFAIELGGMNITIADIKNIYTKAWSEIEKELDSECLHAIPTSYKVDENNNIKSPLNMFGDTLTVDLNMVSVQNNTIKNIEKILLQSYLHIEHYIVASWASGYGVLSASELQLGSLVIDMGAKTTTASVFENGSLVFTTSVPFGGYNVTKDLAQILTLNLDDNLSSNQYGDRYNTIQTASKSLKISLDEAEMIKCNYGRAVAEAADDYTHVPIDNIGGENVSTTILKSMITGVIRPRIEEIFEHLKIELKKSGYDRPHTLGIVLTGGASRLGKVEMLAEQVFKNKVRLGAPIQITMPSEHENQPELSVISGLAKMIVNNENLREKPKSISTKGFINKSLNWIKENL